MHILDKHLTSYTKPKAILFDWDNTLADTWPTIHKALVETFTFMGKEPWTLEETKEHVHRSLRDSFPQIFGDRWEAAGQYYLDHFEAIHLDHMVPLEGAKEMLDVLLEKDIYVAVVSNKTGHNLRKEISHLGWDHYFSKKIGARDAAKDKPYPEPVLLALDGSHIDPCEEVWIIGDTVTDLECAYNTKCKPILYGINDIEHPKFVNCKPHIHFADHQQLKKVIDSFE